jgi:hypothetical protein
MKKRKYNLGGSVTGMSTGNQGYTANNSYNPVEAGLQQNALQRAATGVKSTINMYKGGVVEANCGASMKPNRKARK